MPYDMDNHIGELPRRPLVDIERQRIEECLLQNDGNLTKTAAELGIDRETVRRKRREYAKRDAWAAANCRIDNLRPLAQN